MSNKQIDVAYATPVLESILEAASGLQSILEAESGPNTPILDSITAVSPKPDTVTIPREEYEFLQRCKEEIEYLGGRGRRERLIWICHCLEPSCNGGPFITIPESELYARTRQPNYAFGKTSAMGEEHSAWKAGL